MPSSRVPPRAAWRTSSLSTGDSQNCIEVAPLEAEIAVRDSEDRDGGTLVFGSATWTAFIASARRDDLQP